MPGKHRDSTGKYYTLQWQRCRRAKLLQLVQKEILFSGFHNVADKIGTPLSYKQLGTSISAEIENYSSNLQMLETNIAGRAESNNIAENHTKPYKLSMHRFYM